MLIPQAKFPKAGTKNMIFLHFKPVKTSGVFGPGTLVNTHVTFAVYSDVVSFCRTVGSIELILTKKYIPKGSREFLSLSILDLIFITPLLKSFTKSKGTFSIAKLFFSSNSSTVLGGSLRLKGIHKFTR